MRTTSFVLGLGAALISSTSCTRGRPPSQAPASAAGDATECTCADHDGPASPGHEGAAARAQLAEEIVAIGDRRARIAKRWDATEALIAADPEAGARKVMALRDQAFATHPQVDVLFGPQLGLVDSAAIEPTFRLYDAAVRLETDLAMLAVFLHSNADALGDRGGPSLFGVVFKSNGAMLVHAIAPLCAAAPGAATKPGPENLVPCDDGSKAVAYEARLTLERDSPPVIVLRGHAKGEMQLLIPDGEAYNFAVGLEPGKNALMVRGSLLTRVREGLEEMDKLERLALQALREGA